MILKATCGKELRDEYKPLSKVLIPIALLIEHKSSGHLTSVTFELRNYLSESICGIQFNIPRGYYATRINRGN